jgi:hypothetical protein
MADEQSATVSVLTDGTGISRFTASKVVKDFVADLLLSGAAALAATQIVDVGAALQQPTIVAMAIAGSTIRVIYRAALRWATT